LLERYLSERERLVTDAEVLQEVLHRSAAIDRGEAIQPAWALLPGRPSSGGHGAQQGAERPARGRMWALATQGAQDIADAVNRLVDECRQRCLWFLRPDYYPGTDEERMQVLERIARYGDVPACRRALELRQWLSQASSARSADC
jgi:hypothetical protein